VKREAVVQFVIFKILSILTQPGCLLVLIGVAGLPSAWHGGRIGLGLTTISIVGFAAILLLPLHQWLLLPLEDRFPAPVHPLEHVAGIILLGGAQEVELTEARGVPSFNSQMEMLTAFVALSRRYPNAILAFSGGSGAVTGNRMSEAEVSRLLFEQLGLDRPVIYEGTSRDTYENAVLLKRVVQPAPGGTWLLVTSASHMPRSVGCFEAVGWPVVAWPVAFKSADTAAVQWRHFGAGDQLLDLNTALHEWVGLVVYRLLGRTNALFPRPAGPS
jgi:uncharacterized SAM-binding protein YcdF (DUF218 family)